jgi:acyl transferase domain-containing protein
MSRNYEVLKLLQEKKIDSQKAFAVIRGKEKIDEKEIRTFSVEHLKNSERTENDDIAVIGMSGQFPGAKNIDKFWKNLIEGKNSIVEIPEDRWKTEDFYDPVGQKPLKSNSKWGGFLSDIYDFDPKFFHISPKEAQLMDPQQRLFLLESWKALENTGLSEQKLKRKKCGVFVGYGDGDYKETLKKAGIDMDAHFFMGNSGSILASRISYFLDLRGASISIDTACSSSLVAIHLACDSIRNNTNDIALAGGVSLFTTPQLMLMRLLVLLAAMFLKFRVKVQVKLREEILF